MQRTRFHSGRTSAGTLGAALLALSLPISSAWATDYVVTSGADNEDADGEITLREAINAANGNEAVGDAPAGEPDGDTITFEGPNALGVGGVQTVTLSEALIVLDDVTINGEGVGTAIAPANVAIDGGGATALFAVDTTNAVGDVSAVVFQNMTLTNASAATGAALGTQPGSEVTLTAVDVTDNTTTGNGGAILNQGTMTITDGTMSGNVANSEVMGEGSGGAIFSSGTLTVTGTTFDANQANRAGGAVELRPGSTSTFTNVTMTNNSNPTPNPGNGGALHITGNGNATVDGGTFTGNTAGAEGGALWNGSGTMTITGAASFSGNTASGAGSDQGGGALFNEGGTLTIDGATIDANVADGMAGSGGGILNNGGTLSVENTTISNNVANRAGGGVEDNARETATTTTLNAVDFTGNTAGPDGSAAPGNGGGVHISGPGTFTATGGTVSGNTAEAEGGGFWNGSGVMTLVGVTFDANAANGDDATNGGGGLFNEGGTINLDANTAVTNNTALGAAGSGGGIFNNDGQIVAVGSTITGNLANRAGGGIEDKIESSTPSQSAPSIRLTNVTLDGNGVGEGDGTTANPGNGGGLHVTGSGYVIVTGGTVSANTAAAEGGGLWNFGAPSTMIVSGTTLDGNTANGFAEAAQGGGALFNNGGIMAVSNATISNNAAAGDDSANDGPGGSGGGILNLGGQLGVSGSTFTGNTAVRAGGAIEDRSSGSATDVRITSTVFDGNSTGPLPGNGGALHISGGASTVVVDRSQVSNNTAATEGGGLWNFSGSTLNVYNTTVFGNEATGTDGGGVFSQPNGNTTLLNVTVASNNAGGNGGGVFVGTDSPATSATNALIGDNTATGMGPDVFGTLDGGGYNLVEDPSGATINGPANVTNQDPALDTNGLANNGGPTMTVALQGTSPAIDAGLNSTCASTFIDNTDQRGIAGIRPFDGDGDGTADCDIGAFELNDAPIVTFAANGDTGNEATVVVEGGDTDVAALAFTATNDSDESVTFNGFSGTLNGTGDFGADITSADLVADANGNGVVDASETVVGSVTLDAAANTFSASLDSAAMVASGDSVSYIVAVDFSSSLASLAMPMLAGGGVLLIGLAGAGALTRRQTLVLVGVLAAGTLTACGSSSSSVSGNTGPVTTTYTFTVNAANATGDDSGNPVQPANLPLAGPVLTAN